jgi:hypothetical protein
MSTETQWSGLVRRAGVTESPESKKRPRPRTGFKSCDGKRGREWTRCQLRRATMRLSRRRKRCKCTVNVDRFGCSEARSSNFITMSAYSVQSVRPTRTDIEEPSCLSATGLSVIVHFIPILVGGPPRSSKIYRPVETDKSDFVFITMKLRLRHLFPSIVSAASITSTSLRPVGKVRAELADRGNLGWGTSTWDGSTEFKSQLNIIQTVRILCT